MRRLRFIFICLRIFIIEREIYLFFHPANFVFAMRSAYSFILKDPPNLTIDPSTGLWKKKILKTKLSCGYLGPISQLKQRNILRIFSRESTTGLWTCFMSHSPLDELFTFNKTADQSRGSCVMRFLIHGKWRFSHAGEQLLAVRLNQTHRNK